MLRCIAGETKAAAVSVLQPAADKLGLSGCWWVGFLAWLVCGVGALSTVRAATVYVAPTGANGNTGQSWDTAKNTVAAGLAAAVSGDQVWVATGTYIESITLKSGVALYGGLGGTEPPDFDLAQRNLATHPTVLDGNKASSVVTVPAGATSNTRIDGFIIRNGNASSGGGIYCNSAPTIANNTITGNSCGSYGGGVYCASSASPTIINNTISGNKSNTYGGGIFCSSSANPTISGNAIAANVAGSSMEGSGGGIYCTSCSPLISGNTITGNTAGGGSSGGGGGVFCVAASPTIANNLIAGNAAIGTSTSYGGGIFCSNSSSPVIHNNTVAGNSTGTGGGGIYCAAASNVACINNTVTGNSAAAGGGVYCSSASPTLYNNILAFNSTGVFKNGGTPQLKNNCVYNPGGANYSGLTAGAGDMSLDPRLVLGSFGRAHLAADSPCIEAGLDSAVQAGWVDEDGEARIQGSHVDIGADEFNGTAPPPSTPIIVRVEPAGDDVNDGSSWTLAKQTVQAGIDAASAAGGGEVWVAAGTYRQRIAMKPWVHVYGGFAGGEAGRAQRNWTTQATILDGDGAGGSVVTANACGHASSALDGFTIRNGVATASSGLTYGGGMYCSCALTIANDRFIGNSASYGGGIYCAASPAIFNSVLIANMASINGGAVFCASSAAPVITSNTLIGNEAGSGGGIYSSSASPVIANTIVAFNSSGIANQGGSPSLRNNCVYNPDGADYSGLSAGTGDKSVDPQLLAPGFGEVHLVSGSPCIDAGLDSAVQSGWVDLDGQARIQGASVDIGADEFSEPVPTFTPTVIHVSPSGDDADDGLTWATAKLTVQAAIDRLAAGGGGEVWVSTALYNERIILQPCVYVFGGFIGTEDTRDQRNWATCVTILDGGWGGSVVTATACGHLFSAIDGFTIRSGKPTSSGLPNGGGGGVHCTSSPLIAHNIITGNGTTGITSPGIYCSGSAAPVIANNAITANIGGISASSPAKIFNNWIAGNTGSGITCAAAAVIANNTIVGNNASTGAGIYCSSGSPTLTNNLVAFNSSGIYRAGGSPVLRNNCVYNPGGVNYSGVLPGTGDISVDPLLPAVGYGEIHLAADSPCIDSGLDSVVTAGAVDWDHEPRIQGSHVDIGADEFSGSAWPFAPRIIRVKPTGNDLNDGSTWALALRTVQAGIDAAAAGGGGEVWVAAGTYGQPVSLQTWAHVYGGFAGYEDRREQRDWVANVTTLDGGALGSVVRASSCGYALSTIDGFTIRNGTGTGSQYSSTTTGGAIHCTRASPVIAHNTITGNAATSGSGVYCYYSSPVITNNTMVGNTRGMVIFCETYSSPVIFGNRIAGNSVGAVFCYDSSSPLISGNQILRNGGDPSAGSSISASSSSAPRITNNVIAGNSGAISYGTSSSSSLVIANNTIVGNGASSGGAINCSGAATISNNVVAFNTAGFYKSYGSAPTLRNNCVYNPSGADYNGVSAGVGDLNVDPELASAAFGAFHLSAGSPCIDAGLDTAVNPDWLDIDGEVRGQGAHVDIGADEFNGTTPAIPAVIVRVRSTGSDANDGSSWVLAKRTVQAGIDAAAAVDGGEVWVSAGVYNERIALTTWVYVYGGFEGVESSREQRDWRAQTTVLDGGASGSVVTACAPGHRTSAIDGFTIRNGAGTADSYGATRGGGIYCAASSPLIYHNIVTGNSATHGGGGICCTSSTARPLIGHNTVSGNAGGGIFCENSCLAEIFHNTIAGNTGSCGILCASGSSVIYNNTISGHTSSSGAGIYCGSSASPTIYNNVITANTATGASNGQGGGGVCCGGGSPIIFNNTIVGNTAAADTSTHGGGGILINSGSAQISNNIMAFNSSGICCSSIGSATLRNNCVYNPDRANYTGLSAGAGDISVDPQLLAFAYGDVHLAAGSPCIDAGLDSAVQTGWVDMDGEPRTQGGHVDIGADEFNAATHPNTAAIVRVGPSGNDANDGSTWALAKRTVQAGIDTAAGEGGGEVWVAAGTYSQRITLKMWTHVYGGFTGAEVRRDQRNWHANVTVLDGGGGGSVVTATVPGTGSSTIDGFTIRNGNGTPDNYGTQYGGGIYCSGSSPTISNNTITGNAPNAAGGGIYCVYSSPTIVNNTISGNTVNSYGGGIFCDSNSAPLIRGNTISSNQGGSRGGGIYCYNSAPTITHNVIAGNSASIGGGGQGGGIAYSQDAAPVISNNLIRGNFAAYGGGGIYSNANPAAVISNNTIVENNAPGAGGGGAIYCWGSYPVVSNCILWGNSTPVIFITSGSLNITYSDVQGGYTGTGNINADPLFVSSATGDFHLSGPSPCIDAGNPASDYSLEPEPDGGRINMGAYGNTPEAESRSWVYINGYDLVRTLRISRTLFEYDFTLGLHNASTQAASNVSLQLLKVPANVQIIDPTVDVGLVAAESNVTTQDTFTIRVDRSTPVSAVPISWRLTSAGGTPVTLTGVVMIRGVSKADLNGDGEVNQEDFTMFAACMSGPNVAYQAANRPEGCTAMVLDGFLSADFDRDGDVDQDDFGCFQRCYGGLGTPVEPACAD